VLMLFVTDVRIVNCGLADSTAGSLVHLLVVQKIAKNSFHSIFYIEVIVSGFCYP
jgi:hypothetical protein